MTPWGLHLGLETAPTDRVAFLVSDLSLARAFFEGIPAARLLARVRLGCDERDLAYGGEGAPRFEGLLSSLVHGDRRRRDAVRRAVARHARAAAAEGPLRAPESSLVLLFAAVAASDDPDASLAEITGSGAALPKLLGDDFAARAAAHDERLARDPGAVRAAAMEACIALAAVSRLGPLPLATVADAFATLTGVAQGEPLPRALPCPLYGRREEVELAARDRHMVRVDRAELEALMAQDPRTLALAIVQWERASGRASAADRLVAELSALLRSHGALLLVREPDRRDAAGDAPPARAVAPSWIPEEWVEADVSRLAQALETGLATLPQVRLAASRGGDAALDALGAEMLRATAHPLASAAFADILSGSARPRDVMRLVTYFAVAPEPALAAQALAACSAPELPRVLAAWLEAMVPEDGELAPGGTDPATSSAARLSACIAALAPYPHLYRVLSPILERVSQTPPPPSSTFAPVAR